MESIYIQKIIDNCRLFPDRVAVVDKEGSRQTTYGELLLLAQKTSAYLTAHGITAHDFVPVLLPPCAEYMAVEIGIWITRCVAVPMGDKFPQDRIDYIQEHCDSKLTIDADVLAEIGDWVLGDGCWMLPETEDAALLIYTSEIGRAHV